MSERSKESHSRCDVATREGSNPSLCIFLLKVVTPKSWLSKNITMNKDSIMLSKHSLIENKVGNIKHPQIMRALL